MTSRRNFIKVSTVSSTALLLPPQSAWLPAEIRQTVGTKKKPVIILRTSWNDGNIGDQGHTFGLVRLLIESIPDVEIILWHLNPKPQIEKLVGQNFPKVKMIRGPFHEPEKPLSAELKKAFDRADLFIYNSGMAMNFGLYTHEWAANMASLTPFVYCAENNIPFGIYGQSFDKFEHPSIWIYQNVLNQAAFVYCRDTESLKFLKESGFKTPVLEFGPDAVFGISIRDEQKGLAYLKKEGLEDQKFLAVNILTNQPDPGRQDLLYQANSATLQQDEDRMAKVRQMIVIWVRETGLKVLLAPEMSKEVVPAKTEIYDKLPADVKSKVVWRDTFWNVDEAMSVFARAHTMFGLEPHSLIMGLTMGIPVIHAWPPLLGRKAWMFSDIGLPEWLFQVDDSSAADWTKQLLHIHRDYAGARKKVAKAMEFVQQRQASTMQVINSAIQSRKTRK